jgi:hypothetical protein
MTTGCFLKRKNSNRVFLLALAVIPLLADTAPNHAKRLGKSRTPRARTGYKDIFPDLNVPQYLIVEPTKIGPRYAEYEKLYCSTFKHC